jgi:hypothetical protein
MEVSRWEPALSYRPIVDIGQHGSPGDMKERHPLTPIPNVDTDIFQCVTVLFTEF